MKYFGSSKRDVRGTQQTVHLLDFCVYKLNFMVESFRVLCNSKHRLGIKKHVESACCGGNTRVQSVLVLQSHHLIAQLIF